VPKDGPSAGITILVALASLFTGKSVRPDLALSGEITLRGLVLPVGGIKNKVLAARRAGLKRIILPAKNEKDLEEVPAQAREGLEFTFVGEIAEVLEIALRDIEGATTSSPGSGAIKSKSKSKRKSMRKTKSKTKRQRRRKRGGTDKQPPAPQPS
jgi:ATP-dependent Lon protease